MGILSISYPRPITVESSPRVSLMPSKSIAGGSSGTVTLFTVTGTVQVRLLLIVTEAGSGVASVRVGTAGDDDSILGDTTVSALALGDLWISPTLTQPGSANLLSNTVHFATSCIINDENIIATRSAAVIALSLSGHCLWTPLSEGATVEAA